MKPAPFRMLRPASLQDAMQMLAEHGADAKVIAGGQSLVPMMNLRMATPEILVDIAGIADLRFIKINSSEVRIGATVVQASLIADERIQRFAPLLHRAATHVGHVQTRARGTLGGSLAHADPAAELCLAVAALDGVLVLRRLGGSREVSAREFFQSALTTALEPDELLCEVVIPKAGARTRAAFHELSRRHGDFAIAAVGLQVDPDAPANSRLRGAVGGVVDAPYVFQFGQISRDVALDRSRAADAIERELDRLVPNSDIHASADYRLSVSKVLAMECVTEVLS